MPHDGARANMEQISNVPTAWRILPRSPERLLQDLEALVASACQQRSFEQVLQRVQSTTASGSGCTAVWTAGAIAYRCKTCQLTASSAVCVSCFKAGNHEGHDFIVYRSPAGGCCDCGDISSWALEGCCARHRPGVPQEVDLSQVLGQAGAAALTEAATLVLADIVFNLTAMMEQGLAPAQRAIHTTAAATLSTWLSKLAACPPLRSCLCATATTPLADVAAQQDAKAHDLGESHPVGRLCKEVAGKVHALMKDITSCPTGPKRKDCLARRLVCYMEHMPEATLTDATTLLMLLLYDPPFKFEATLHFMDFYYSMLRAVVAWALRQPPTQAGAAASRGLGTSLDRLTVQLLNSEEVTCRLVHEESALYVVFQTLHYLVDQVLSIMAASKDGDQDAAQTSFGALFGGYRRVLGDLHTMAHYHSVAHTLLTDPRLMSDNLLLFLGKMQCMAPQVCLPPGQAAAREPHASVSAASNLELITAHSVSEVVATCTGSRPQQVRPEGAVDTLSVAARQCLECLIDWASSQPLVAQPGGTSPGLDVRYVYDRMRAGQLPVSPHLPLHRTTATFIQALLSLELDSDPAGQAAVTQTLTGLLRQLAAPCSPPQLALHSNSPALLGGLVSTGQAAARHIFMLQAFLSQIFQRIWVRNGDDALHVELAYHMWNEYLESKDLLMIMVALAAGPPAAVLLDMMQTMGAGPLLVAAGYVSSSGALTDLVAAEDTLRLLVALLRGRTVCGTPPSYRLRQLLLHSLALADAGHAQLIDMLPSDLSQRTTEIDEVLAELATYRPPSLSSAGQYCLRKEAWTGFDPHFQHFLFVRKSLPKAMERAAAAGVWKPSMQLRRPSHPLPPSLESMMAVLDQPQLAKLIAYIIQHHMSGGPPRLSEDLLMSALNLLALQLHRLEDLVSKTVAVQGPRGKAPAGGLAGASSAPAESPEQRAAEQAIRVVAPMLLGATRRENYGQASSGVLHSLRQLVSSGGGGGRDVVDCCQVLVAQAEGPLAAARAAGLLAEDVGGGAAEDRAKGRGPAALAASEGTPPADDAKSKARERQQALMDRMRAQQAAFMQSKGRQSGAGPSPSVASGTPTTRMEGLEGEEEEEEEEQQAVAASTEEEEEEAGRGSEGEVEVVGSMELDEDEEEEEEGAASSPRWGRTPARLPAMGTWGPVSGECVLCQSSSTTGRLGPLGLVGHVGICSCLSVPLLPERQTASSFEIANAQPTVGPAVLQPGQRNQPAGSAGVQPAEPVQQPQLNAADSGGGLGGPLNPSLTLAVQPAVGGARQVGTAQLGEEVVRRRLRRHGPGLSVADWQPGAHVHTCGHMLHHSCFISYRSNLLATAANDPLFPGYHLLSTARREFMCPMCRRLSNCLLPAAQFTWRAAAPATGPQGSDPSQPDIGPALTAAPSHDEEGQGGPGPSHTQAKAARRSTLGGRRPAAQAVGPSTAHRPTPPRPMQCDDKPGTGPQTNEPTRVVVSGEGGYIAAQQLPGLVQGACLLLSGLPSGPAATAPSAAAAPSPTDTQRPPQPNPMLVDAASQYEDDALLDEDEEDEGAVEARERARAILRRLVGQAEARTWAGMSSTAFGDLAPVALDLAKQVSVEVIKHTSCVERALEQRALLVAREIATAAAQRTATAATTSPAQGARQAAVPAPGALVTVPGLAVDMTGVAEAGEVGALAQVVGAGGGVAGGTRDDGGGSSGSADSGQGAGTEVPRSLQPPQEVAPYLNPPPVRALDPAQGVAGHPALMDFLTQFTRLSQDAARLTPGGALPAPASAHAAPAAVPAPSPSRGAPGAALAFAIASAMACQQAGPNAPAAANILVQPPTAAAQPWKPSLSGETAAEVRRRWQHEPTTPSLWALLAHNLAHWEALRRPAVLRDTSFALPAQNTSGGGGGGTLPAAATPLGPPGPSRPAPAAAPPAPTAQPGAIANAAGGPLASARRAGGVPGAAAGASRLRPRSLPAGCITGQEVVEGAHLSALHSVTNLCVALGTGLMDRGAAAQQLHAMLAWLLGAPGDAGAAADRQHHPLVPTTTPPTASGTSSYSPAYAVNSAAAAAQAVQAQGLAGATSGPQPPSTISGPSNAASSQQQASSAGGQSGGGAAAPLPRAPLCATAGLLTEYDVHLTQHVLRAFFDDTHRQAAAQAGGLRILCSRQAADAQQLLADPLLLVLELLALSLSAHGAPAPTATNHLSPNLQLTPTSMDTAPSPPSTQLLSSLPVQQPGVGSSHQAPAMAATPAVQHTPATLLSAVLQVVLPAVVLQAAAWLLTARQPHELDLPGQPYPDAATWHASVLQGVHAMVAAGASGDPAAAGPGSSRAGGSGGGGAGRMTGSHTGSGGSSGGGSGGGCGSGVGGGWAAQAREALAAHLLPLLVRCYLLHCLLRQQRPALDDPLMVTYASLFLDEDVGETVSGGGGPTSSRSTGACGLGPIPPGGGVTSEQAQQQPATGFLAGCWSNIQNVIWQQPRPGAAEQDGRDGEGSGRGEGACVRLANRLCAEMDVQGVTQALQEAVSHITLGPQKPRQKPPQPQESRAASAAAGPMDFDQAVSVLGPDQDTRGTELTAWGAQTLMRWAGHVAWAAGVPLGGPGGPASGTHSGTAAGAHSGTAVRGLVTQVNQQQGAGGVSQQVSEQGGPQQARGDVRLIPSTLALALPSPLAVLRPAPTLIALPPTFQDLFLQLTDKPCYMCGKTSESPSLCLVTGRLVCSWWRGCHNNHGGGLLHALEACGGNTLMLSLKSTKVMALRPNRLTICQSPFLDSHGEEDTDLRRGRPLYLNAQVYSQLGSLWAASATEFDSQLLQSSRVDLVFL